MVSIYDYNDYRDFIKEFQLLKLQSNSHFSYRYLAQKASINSPSFFADIVKGSRNLTKNTILKTCNALKLDDAEAEYFENLVFFNQAKKIEQKNYYFKQIIELQKCRTIRPIDDDQYKYFSTWYHSVIRELITYYDFKEDYKKLGSLLNPPISEKLARDSVSLLLELGLVKRDNDSYILANPLIKSDSATLFKTHQIMHYQVDMLKNAIRAYDKVPPHKRLTSATTVSISKDTYKRFVQILRDTRAKLLNLAENDFEPDNTFVLSVNLFAATETIFNRGDKYE